MRYEYRLQRREEVAMPNILGNHSMPVYTYRWKDIAACDERDPLEEMMRHCYPAEHYRIIDTQPDWLQQPVREEDT